MLFLPLMGAGVVEVSEFAARVGVVVVVVDVVLTSFSERGLTVLKRFSNQMSTFDMMPGQS